jgi:hypothetical protein
MVDVGIALMLNIFRDTATLPKYRVVAPPNGQVHELKVHEEVAKQPYPLL